MVQSDILYGVYCAFAAAVFWCGGWMAGSIRTSEKWMSARRLFLDEAEKLGYIEYYLDDNKDKKWRWKDGKSKLRYHLAEANAHIATLTDQLQADPPPDGYPSWEELERLLRMMTAKSNALLSELKRVVDEPNSAAIERHEKEIAIARTALAAAKKEAGRCDKCHGRGTVLRFFDAGESAEVPCMDCRKPHKEPHP